MQRYEFRCFHRLRVRWVEVDMQKIVFNAHYLMYIDTAMMDYWRALALPYEASMEVLGGEMYVKKATVEYHASAILDDTLDVALRCARMGNSSVLFQTGIFRGDQRLIEGELVYVFADPATQTSRPVPAALRKLLTDYEAGHPVVTAQVGTWSALGKDAARVRQEVFVQEMDVALEEESDGQDATAVHAVLHNALDMPVAAGRLLPSVAGVARIERLAVDRSLRGAGWGSMLLDALVQAAQERGDSRVALDAQASAQAFYQRAGFVVCGAPFMEAGLQLVPMERALSSQLA